MKGGRSSSAFFRKNGSNPFLKPGRDFSQEVFTGLFCVITPSFFGRAASNMTS